VSQTFSAVQVYLACLRQHTPVREQPINSNKGQMVEAYQKACGGKAGDPWCMQILNYTGKMAFGKAWPLRMTGSTNEAAADAKAQGVLLESSQGEPGDILLLWSTSKGKFHHAATIAAVTANGEFTTYEGNTNDDGSREGYGFFTRTRRMQLGDKVIKWSRLV
jgi:hypothetical protein